MAALESVPLDTEHTSESIVEQIRDAEKRVQEIKDALADAERDRDFLCQTAVATGFSLRGLAQVLGVSHPALKKRLASLQGLKALRKI